MKTSLLTSFFVLLLTASAPSVFGQVINYDLGSVYVAPPGPTVTPITLDGAIFTSPTDPGAFTVGQNNGLYGFGDASTYYLSDAGFPATLTINFSTPQTSISFDYANGDFFESNGGDTLTFTTNTGASDTATNPSFDSSVSYFPYGSFSYSSTLPFTSVTISNSDNAGAEDLAIADITTTTAPEPSTWALVLGGVGAIAFLARRKQNA